MNSTQIRIAYADTDQMGMVYYGNYLTFFERGRTEYMRQIGLEYTKFEEMGYYLPVIHCECDYMSPAKYDDLITIETKLTELTAVTLTCSYQIKCGEKLLAKGKTKHPIVNKAMKPTRISKELREMLRQRIDNRE